MLLVDIDFCSLADLDDIYAIEEAAHGHPWPYEIIESDLRHKTGQIFYIGARWNGFCADSVPVAGRKAASR